MNKISMKKFQIAKMREYYLSLLGGILSGIAISIGFIVSEMDPNPSKNLFYQLTTILSTIFILWVMYNFGICIIKFLKKYTNFPKGSIFNFKLNFIAGLVASIFIGLLVMFKEDKWIILIIGVIIVIITGIGLHHIKRK